MNLFVAWFKMLLESSSRREEKGSASEARKCITGITKVMRSALTGLRKLPSELDMK
jgi:hypothetical protein